MSDYTPTLDEVREDWCQVAGQVFDPDAQVRREKRVAAFNRMIAEVERAAAEKAWDEGESAGQHNAGDGFAALLSGMEAPEPKTNPYRAAVIRERKGE